ncbi:AAA family ATPase [Leeia sp.]|uniref:AAA family ATPase n=1 Tax=Leeia sp. TaxID=2884678 RepID=UPI0035B4D9C8
MFTSHHSKSAAVATAPAHPVLQQALTQLGQQLLGKPQQIRLALACLLARGHLLLEDVPGVGKTTLAHALAQTLGLGYQRVQFTSDLLPADLIGISIYVRETGQFEFHRGPLFSQLVLADEINRASPKAQSALLEAMAERQVTHDGTTYALPDPFFVIATQNPLTQIGTHPLPESQLDRFTLRLSLGYPDARFEKALYQGQRMAEVQQALRIEQVRALQADASAVHAADPLIDYVMALIHATRDPQRFQYGLSPRAGLALLAVARSWALLAGRDMVLPEDVQAVFPHVAAHRLQAASGAGASLQQVSQLLLDIPLP